jgi:phage gp36-like protein
VAYTTPDDVRAVLDPDWQAGVTGGDTAPQSAAALSDEQLQQAIDEAAAQVDGYLAGRYVTPLAPTPAAVATVTRDFAAWRASLTYARGLPLPADDPVRLRYADAMSLLIALATGRATLPGAEQATQDGSSSYAGAADTGMSGLFDAADYGWRPRTPRGGVLIGGSLDDAPWYEGFGGHRYSR